jgi:mucin-19
MANTRTVGASGADHTSIGAALSWMQSNHNFNTDGIATIEIIDSAAYDESLTISGIAGTPSSTAYLKITVSSGNRHSGAAGTGHARISYSGGNTAAIQVETPYTVIEDLEIYRSNPGSSDEGVRITSGVNGVVISRCVIWSDGAAGDTDGIYAGNWPVTVNVDNCIIYGFNRCGINAQNFGGGGTQTWNIDSCTIYDCGSDDTPGDGGIVARADFGGDTANFNVYNTAALDSNGTNAADFAEVGGGTFNWTGTHNADTDGSLTAVGITSSAQQNLTITATTQSSGSYFVVNSLTAGSEDLTLLDDAAGNLAYGNGVSRVGSEPDSRQDFSLDIAGNTRSTTSPSPDIGASEYTAAGGGVTVNLSGQSSTLSQGSLSAAGAALISLVGQSATSSQGSITVTAGGSITVSLAGNAITTAQGALTEAGAANVSLSGHSSTVSQGTLAPTGAALVALSGNSATASQGAMTVTTAAPPTVVNLTGVAITANIGSVNLQTANVITLAGQSVNLFQGTLATTGGGWTIQTDDSSTWTTQTNVTTNWTIQNR